MSDITKAKFFLNHRNSTMATLPSFGLMLATAESKYRAIKLRQKSQVDAPGTWKQVETEASVDYAVLKYLSKHNCLPAELNEVFNKDTSLERKQELVIKWYNS